MKRLGMALVLVLLLAAVARAAEPPESVYMIWGISDDGGGHVFAGAIADGSWTITWQACTSDGACDSATPSPTDARSLDAGDAPAGTTFVATASNGTRSMSAATPPYRGRLRFFSPPSVVGSVRTGHFVRPVPGTWLGGWGDEWPLLQLQVCKTRRNDGCKVIADTYYWHKCPGAGARIAQRYAGWYLRVADTHLGRDVVFAQRAYERPEDINPVTATSAVTAIATIGRIARGHGPNRRC
ncbi:MAG TPA: hypothetical protein VF066_07485 [Thermoleophilaceae bacterium]